MTKTPTIPGTAGLLQTAGSVLSTPTRGTIILVGILAIAVFYGLSAGRKRVISSIIYTYVALALLPVLPLTLIGQLAGNRPLWQIKIAAFLALFFLLVVFLGRGRLFGFPAARGLFQGILLSILQAGLLLHVILTALPQSDIQAFSPLVQKFVANPDYTLWWLAVPLAILIIIRRIEAKNEW